MVLGYWSRVVVLIRILGLCEVSFGDFGGGSIIVFYSCMRFYFFSRVIFSLVDTFVCRLVRFEVRFVVGRLFRVVSSFLR